MCSTFGKSTQVQSETLMDIWYEGTCPTKTNPYQNRSNTSENKRVWNVRFSVVSEGTLAPRWRTSQHKRQSSMQTEESELEKLKTSQTTREECFWRVEKSSKRQCVASNSLASSPFPFFPFFNRCPSSVSNKWYILRKNIKFMFLSFSKRKVSSKATVKKYV